jgi:hypothetical protein
MWWRALPPVLAAHGAAVTDLCDGCGHARDQHAEGGCTGCGRSRRPNTCMGGWGWRRCTYLASFR